MPEKLYLKILLIQCIYIFIMFIFIFAKKALVLNILYYIVRNVATSKQYTSEVTTSPSKFFHLFARLSLFGNVKCEVPFFFFLVALKTLSNNALLL